MNRKPPFRYHCWLRAALCALVLLIGSAANAATSCIVWPEMCSTEVWRVETAYQAGARTAANDREKLECLRWRNAALRQLVEISYSATLTALSDSAENTMRIEVEQSGWLEQIHRAETLLEKTQRDFVCSQEVVSLLLLERLRALSQWEEQALEIAHNY